MTTTTSATLQEQADELAAQAAAQRAEEQRQAEGDRQRRDELTEQWYREQRGNIDVGPIDEAWSRFVEAVTTGGDTVAAWRDYRITFRTVRARNHAVQEWFDRRDRAAAQAVDAQYHYLAKELRRLRGVQVPRDIPREEWERATEAWRQAATAYVGRDCSDVDPKDDTFELPLPPRIPPAFGGGREIPDPRVPGDGGYAAAVDVVVRQLEEQALRDERWARQAELEAYVGG